MKKISPKRILAFLNYCKKVKKMVMEWSGKKKERLKLWSVRISGGCHYTDEEVQEINNFYVGFWIEIQSDKHPNYSNIKTKISC